jgi:hypothetical protein
VGDLAGIFPFVYVILALPAGRWLDARFGQALGLGASLTGAGGLVRLAGPSSYGWAIAGQFVIAAGLLDPAGLFGGTPRRFQSSGVPVAHDLFCGRLAPRPASCLAAEWCGHVDAAAALAGCSRAHCEDGAFVVPSGEPGDADPR